MKILSGVLVLFCLFTFIFALVGSNGAPQEAAAAGLACIFGILARIAQATQHHQELLEKLSKPVQLTSPPKPILDEPGVIVV